MSSPLVSLENVEVHFDTNESIFDSVPLLDVGSKETVRAVDGVSFDIEENDVDCADSFLRSDIQQRDGVEDTLVRVEVNLDVFEGNER